ncbi:MAG: HAMP domain-containing sensor histidine kinase [Bacilli bacterium]
MKKNHHEGKSPRCQRLYFLLYNLLAYLVIFAVLGAFIGVAVNDVFFKEAKRSVYAYSEELKSGFLTNQIRPSQEQFMNVAFFNEYGVCVAYYFTSGVVERSININEGIYDHVHYEIITQIMHYSGGTVIVDSNYITLLQTVDVDFLNASYMKIYINVDGEMHSRNQIISVYLFSTVLILALSSAASYIMSSASIKPIMLTLEKQASFVSDASHELRTPLAIVQSKIENIMTDPSKTVMEVSEDLAISLKELSRLNKLTSDLLTLAHNDNNSFVLDYTLIDLKELISEIAEPFKELATLQNKTFIVEVEAVKARVDQNKINQLMIILLDNALQYTIEGEEICIRGKVNGSDVIINVIDTGMGIQEENRKRIFERFFREDKARSRSISGNGLGLSIAKTIVVHHRGKISCEPNHPKGTIFTVILPRRLK